MEIEYMRKLNYPGLSIGAFLLVFCSLVLIPLATTAHEGAKGIVMERMTVMKGLGTAMKEITAMLRGTKGYDGAALAVQARRIRDHGGKTMTRLFPEGSADGPSEASSEIWRRWAEFETLAQDLVSRAEALAVAAEKGAALGQPDAGGGKAPRQLAAASPDDAVAPAQKMPMAEFAALTKSCSACHRDFRIKK